MVLLISKNKYVGYVVALLRLPLVALTLVAMFTALILTTLTFSWRSAIEGFSAYFGTVAEEYEKQVKEKYNIDD